MEEECCQFDALLDDVVSHAKAARLAICSRYDDPEEAFTDGYIAGWFDGHFQRTPDRTPRSCEPNRTEQVNP